LPIIYADFRLDYKLATLPLEQLQDKLVAFDASKPLRKRPRFF
jgi:hypothetical protein